MKRFRLPDLGEGLQEAEVVEWRVKEGDVVSVDQPLLAVETAKAVVEVPTPRAGRIERLFAKAGDMLQVGTPLVAFEDGEDEDAGAVVGAVETGTAVETEHPVSVGHGRGAAIKATPAVRALARQLSVDLSIVTPTGPDGLVTVEDVRRVEKVLSEAEPAEPLRGSRRAMARNMAQAHEEVVAATIMDDALVSAWSPDCDVTIRLIRALTRACAVEPSLNCWFETATMSRRVLRRIDLGVAIDAADGLFVPVLKDVGRLAPDETRAALDRLREEVASRRISPEELRGASITLSNFGAIGGRYASPVVTPPTVAILAAGRIRREPVLLDGAISAGRVLPLSLTFDHRVVSGGEAARFLGAVIEDLSCAA